VLHLGWTNIAGLLFVNLYFYIFNQQRFRADTATIPALQQALPVVRKFMKHSFALLLSISICMTNTANAQKFKLEVKGKDTVSFIKISLERILEDIDKYDHSWVEIEGTYKYGYEFSLISPSVNPGKPRASFYGLWVAFNMTVFKPLNPGDCLSKLTDKKVRIRGKVDKQNNGHLNKFLGSISNVYYIEEL
jgi:hypothetical protein